MHALAVAGVKGESLSADDLCAATGLATTLNLRAALSWLSRQISAALGTAWWPFTAVARYAMPKQISGWWLQIVHEHTVVDDTPKDDDKA